MIESFLPNNVFSICYISIKREQIPCNFLEAILMFGKKVLDNLRATIKVKNQNQKKDGFEINALWPHKDLFKSNMLRVRKMRTIIT